MRQTPILPVLLLLGACAPGPSADPPPAPEPHDPGRVVLHRLNRDEYDRTVRDLLDTSLTPGREFPADDRSAGFDNIATSLTLTDLHAEHHLEAAEALAADALARGAGVRDCDRTRFTEAQCFKSVLGDLATRAWRRPLTDEERARLLALGEDLSEAFSYDEALEYGIVSVLISPSFLFRPEPLADPHDPSPQPLSDWVVASRLSYFLWSSMPDEALFEAAEAGALQTVEGIEAQVRRMLVEPRADALLDNFAGQWLYLRGLDGAVVDEGLAASMREETRRFVASFVASDRDLHELLTARRGPVDARLAHHYGIGGAVEGWGDVDLEGVGRGGVLGQAGLLTVLSHQTHTSPVKRGQFVLTQLLCDAPEGPPPGVEGLVFETATSSQRAQLEAHRSEPTCRACHATMDELGFALEHFGPTGAWREHVAWGPIDATARLPDGTVFYGAQALSDWVAADPRFPACMVRQAFTYALGRVPSEADEPALQAIEEDFRAGGFTFSGLAVAIATSVPFRQARGEAP